MRGGGQGGQGGADTIDKTDLIKNTDKFLSFDFVGFFILEKKPTYIFSKKNKTNQRNLRHLKPEINQNKEIK